METKEVFEKIAAAILEKRVEDAYEIFYEANLTREQVDECMNLGHKMNDERNIPLDFAMAEVEQFFLDAKWYFFMNKIPGQFFRTDKVSRCNPASCNPEKRNASTNEPNP